MVITDGEVITIGEHENTARLSRDQLIDPAAGNHFGAEP
jgi:hypothetical protein